MTKRLISKPVLLLAAFAATAAPVAAAQDIAPAQKDFAAALLANCGTDADFETAQGRETCAAAIHDAAVSTLGSVQTGLTDQTLKVGPADAPIDARVPEGLGFMYLTQTGRIQQVCSRVIRAGYQGIDNEGLWKRITMGRACAETAYEDMQALAPQFRQSDVLPPPVVEVLHAFRSLTLDDGPV